MNEKGTDPDESAEDLAMPSGDGAVRSTLDWLGELPGWLGSDRVLFGASLAASLAASMCMVAIPPLAARLLTAAEPGDSLLLVLVLVLRAGLGALGVFGIGLCAARAITRVRDRLFARLVAAPISFHDREWSADQVSVLSSDMAAIQQTVGNVLPALAQQLPTFAAGAIYLFVVDSRFALALSVALSPVAIFTLLATRALRGLAREGQARLGRLAVTALDTLRQIRSVKALRAERALERRFEREGARLFVIKKRRALWQGLIEGVVPVAIVLLALVAVQIGQSRIVAGAFDKQSALTFAGLLGVMAATGGRLVRALAGLGRVSGAADRVRALEKRCTDLPRASEPARLKPVLSAGTAGEARMARPLSNGASIEMNDVRFRHSTTGGGLEGVDLRVEPGEWVGLRGSNGSGKSTLLFLLLGFYRPDGGTIRIDGRGLDEVGLERWRSRIAWVGAEPAVFPATVAENLRLGSPEATDSEIEAAARAAGIHGVISALPGGYSTVVGEEGLQLSSGQRHRLALARLLLRQPSIILLDEADSSLDPSARRELPATLREWFADRTLVAVSHDPSADWSFDRRLELKKGTLLPERE